MNAEIETLIHNRDKAFDLLRETLQINSQLREQRDAAVKALEDPNNHWHSPNEIYKYDHCTACEALKKIRSEDEKTPMQKDMESFSKRLKTRPLRNPDNI